MSTLAEIEARLDSPVSAEPVEAARALLADAEAVLEHWVTARGEAPTADTREGFRLLALHRQGARGEPSFNACRETCREIAYHYNLIHADPGSAAAAQAIRMMAMLVRHLTLFVSGKLQVAGLGEFCCSSRPLRIESA
ncbi:MAG TPA: hypothetical protein VLD15_07390 [Burkholderiales bacterium]|nr:hypothetical protein [Burkholderiales bacterium]